MADKNPPVTAHQLTVALLSVATVIDAVIKAANVDRSRVVASILATKSGLSDANRKSDLGTLLDMWALMIEKGPEKISPSDFH